MNSNVKSQNPIYKRRWFLIIVGILSFPIWPFLIGGLGIYKTSRSKLSKKVKSGLMIGIALLTLLIGSAWSAGFMSASSKSKGSDDNAGAGSSGVTTSPVPEHFSPTPTSSQAQIRGAETSQERARGKVIRVIDGDTIEIEGGQKVRYIGIDTPEITHPDETAECFGREATAKNRELVEGKEVELEKDVSETDKYGRLLRYVYVGEIMVNDYLVRQGYAYAVSFPPDVKYQEQLRAAQAYAQEDNRGLWGKCRTADNADADSTAISGTSPSPSAKKPETPTGGTDCLIKGNINADGEKIYHLPGCQSYSKTKIDNGKGERWFCSEQEALAAGWRKAKNCP